ncbi:MAG TPA: cytochrome c biogenesis protein ResB [Candidatus Limnocylindrales bacterium]|nr:cytochrome c biogenesis protein ResB [Candidatus Limnocylindrales bacterium]
MPTDDRLVRGAERALRLLGDGRTGIALLLLVGLLNVAAALHPDGPRALDSWPYGVLLGVLALAGVAAVAVRAPGAWREWRRPTAVHAGPAALELRAATQVEAGEVVNRLSRAGYRVALQQRRGRWAVHGVRRGWSRFAGQASHLAIVLIVLGAAIGAAFGSETLFSLHSGDQALLDAPRAGFSSAARLESFDAEFGPDGRPRRLDTTVTFLREGHPVREARLRVNEPGSFDGYLVHPWTYGPSAELRVTTLGGSPLLDAPVPLTRTGDGVPAGSVSLPTAGTTLGLALSDASVGELGVSVLGRSGLVDTARLLPGEEQRIGNVVVALLGFDTWVTFLSRSDPGLGLLFGGAALLCLSLAIAFWLPRRRITVRPLAAGGAVLVLRGERFDRPTGELERVAAALGWRT